MLYRFCDAAKGQGAGAEREVPKEEGEENLVVRRGEKTWDVNRQNKKKNHDAEQSRSQAPLYCCSQA